MFLALFRRLVCNLIPQDYSLIFGSQKTEVATYGQCFNPFVFKLKVNLQPNCPVPTQLVLAGGILLTAIEGRQQ